MSHPIEAPKPTRRPWGLLLDNAAPLDVGVGDRWRAGVKFASYGCEGLRRTSLPFCLPDSETDLDADPVNGSLIEFGSFSVYATEACSTLDVDHAWLSGRLDDRFTVMVSEQVAAEVAGGTNATITDPLTPGAQSPTFASEATIVTTGPLETDVIIAMLEQELAERLHGGIGMIHMSPAVFSMVAADQAIRDGSQWRTRSGHLIVSDAGYAGVEPEGEAPVDRVEWVYGTGPVLVHVGPPRLTDPAGTIGYTRNVVTGRAVAEAVAVFEPCTVVAAEYGYPDFLSGSGS